MTPSSTRTTAKARKQDIKRQPAKRATPGAGRKLLLQALATGTSARADLIKRLQESGIAQKSVPTILKTAKRDKLVTSNRGVYELSARGRIKAIAE
jgi:hypothetical protein